MVSYPAWHHCVSPRQETVREGFPTRHGTIVFHRGRKLFAKGFLLGMAPLSFTAAGNYSRIVSYSAWHHCVSSRQETVREGFPTRHGTIVFHRDRKLFAKGFLLYMKQMVFTAAGNCSRRGFLPSMAPLCFIMIGNCSRRVSYSAWHHCVSPRQETVCEGFPTRHGTIVFHRGRKLFAKGFLLGMAPLFSNTIGNCSQRFFYSHE
jgi:hypothetical protein